jgi:hypothetical protein
VAERETTTIEKHINNIIDVALKGYKTNNPKLMSCKSGWMHSKQLIEEVKMDT